MLDIQYIDSVFKPLVPTVSKPKKKKEKIAFTGGVYGGGITETLGGATTFPVWATYNGHEIVWDKSTGTVFTTSSRI